MRVRAQFSMVMNLDKCIGCHTCSLTCKSTWTNRRGTEYMWWNNVETKPGIGYPKLWENQDKWRGGWELRNGKLQLRSGGRLTRLLRIFHNPDLPTIDDFYEPWGYNYENLIGRKPGKYQPAIHPQSRITGDFIKLSWGPNWEDDLAGVHITGMSDPDMKDIEEQIYLDFEKVFMRYLPRICEHCLNPGCLAACPHGAIYKREEDGIVLVDQEICRGWRFCVSGCPYKKTYYNWDKNKAEKCIFCYPRIESGITTVCSETCVGRIRYVGIILYDADAVERAASVEDPTKLYQSHLDIFLDPNDPEVIKEARQSGITEEWLEAARRSPIYKLAVKFKIALPLHPEYRTLPMVWYVPPLSPIINAFERQGQSGTSTQMFPAIDDMRIPIQYLANILTVGDTEIVRGVLKKMLAMRIYMRAQNLGKQPDLQMLKDVGLDEQSMMDMYRLLAIAKYHDRFVVPPAHPEYARDVSGEQGDAGLTFGDKNLGG